MPRRKAGWVPALTHLGERGQGRARFPGQPDMYFGSVGDWPTEQDRPPEAIRRAYEAACAAWLARKAKAFPPPSGERGAGPWTCGQVAAGYVASLAGRPGQKPTANALRAVVALYARLPAGEFGGRELDQCRRWFLERGASPRTVNDYAGRIRSAFRWAAAPEREGCPADVVVRLAAVRPLIDEDEVPVEPASVEDVLAAARAAPPVVRAMLLLQLYSGMRPGEVVQMRAGDIFCNANSITKIPSETFCNANSNTKNPSEPECWLYKPRLYKSRRSAAVRAQGGRRVWLGPRAQAVLSPWLAGKADDAPVFPSRLGRPYSVQGYRKAVVEACGRAGVSAFTPQQVRHTALTAAEEAFGSIDYAQAMGGHTRPDVTRRYARGQDRLAREAAARLG